MPLRDASEVGVPDIRRFSGLRVDPPSQTPDPPKRAARPARRPTLEPSLASVPAPAPAPADHIVDPPATVPAEDQRAVPRAATALLGDERQVYLQADVPEVVLQRVKDVGFELTADHPHLGRHQFIVGALVWEYVDHTDQRKLDELADLLDAHRAGPWHGLPEVRRLSARIPASLKRRTEGAVIALAQTHRDASAKAIVAALVARHVVSRQDDEAVFRRLVDVVGGYHQELSRRSLTAPVARPAH